MTHKFLVETIITTSNTADAKQFEVTFADSNGQLQTIGLTSAIAGTLAKVLADFAVGSHSLGPVATKMPREFAVGVGRLERVVLVRFEDDAPYGLEIDQATQLGRVLIENAEAIAASPKPILQ